MMSAMQHWIWTGLAVATVASSSAMAQTRRALLIGIDQYTIATARSPSSMASLPDSSLPSRRWIDLDGAVNDARAMREVLIARFGFESKDVLLLTNAEATRQEILNAFVEHLVRPVQPGDVSVFFYAGHGSQMRNSRCVEPDCKDETIVPADSNRGALDIRDKEWERLFNDALDKGALLTVFFDSCHSGSISRGLSGTRKVRFLPPDPRDAAGFNDPVDTRPAPKERGALIISATLDFQTANEVVDGQGMPHGAFSLALIKTLRTMPPDEAAENLYRRVRALVQANGVQQDPTMEATPARGAQPLFGGKARLTGHTVVAVRSIGRDGSCVLQGGSALGLCRGCELRRFEGVDDGSGANSVEPVRLRVESVSGLDRCVARPISGMTDAVAPGALFEVDRWMGCDEPFLRVWVPAATPDYESLRRAARELLDLRSIPGINLVGDPVAKTPTHVVFWEDARWRLYEMGGGVHDLGKSLSAATLREYLRPLSGEKFDLLVSFPPPLELRKHLHFAPANPENPIELVSTRRDAHYLLVGRARSDTLEYAWVLPTAPPAGAEREGPLPRRTDWCGLQGTAPPFKSVAASLDNLARRTGKLRMWLQLEAPPADGRFPYRLAIRNTGGDVKEGSTVREGDTLHVVLDRDEKKLRQSRGARYVYVFTFDKNGKSQLLLPRSGDGNSGNRFGDPLEQTRTEVPVRTVVVGSPFGVDTYVMLWTKDPLPDPGILERPPVRNRGGPHTPLAMLLEDLSTGSRRGKPRRPTPVDWSIQRLWLRSVPIAGAAGRP